MPTETGTAFLVDPMGYAPVALTEDEFNEINRYLSVARDEKEHAVRRAIDWLLYMATEADAAQGDKAVVGRAIYYYLSELDEGGSGGILSNAFGKEIEVLSDREFEILGATLATIRAGGWFADWLAVQCGIRADASQHPDDRFASPLRVAASLVNCVKEFEADLEAARDFARMRPDLVFPESQAMVAERPVLLPFPSAETVQGEPTHAS